MAAAKQQDDAAGWNDVAPMLDEGLNKLGRADRDALLLRFFEQKSLREIGTAMGTSEEAAQKRVTRAVEKLRSFFRRRGVATLSVATLTVLLEQQAVQAAPATLAATSAASAGTSSALAKGAVTLMAVQQAKVAVVAAAAVLIAVGGAVVGIKSMTSSSSSSGGRRVVVPVTQRSGPGIAAFPDGTVVEVMGICELDDSSNSLLGKLASLLPATPSTSPATTQASATQWWSADGSPVDGSSFPAPMGNLSLGDDSKMRRLRIVTRVSGDLGPGGNVMISLPVSSSMISDIRATANERYMNCSVAVSRGVEQTDVRVGKSQGEWRDVVDVRVSSLTSKPTTSGSVIGAIGEENGMTTAELFQNRLKLQGTVDRRYFAVKKDGTRVMSRQMRGYQNKAVLYFGCRKQDVDRVVIATRPLEWLTIPGVSLKPKPVTGTTP